jgi:hypothetical protein
MVGDCASWLEKLRRADARATIFVVSKLVWATCLVCVATGCSSSSTETSSFADASFGLPPAATSDAGTISGGAVGSDAETAPTFTTSVRFAHLAPGLGSVDFCWRSSATDPFQGPLLGGGPPTTDFDASYPAGDGGDGGNDGGDDEDAASNADSGSGKDGGVTTTHDGGEGDAGDGGTDLDAGPSPLAYLSVSPTLTLASTGQIDVIAIEPGATCGAPLVLGHVTLASTARTTLLLAGGVQADASGGLGISALEDETTAADTTRSSVRVVNAALVPSMGSFTATLEQSGYDVPLADDVPPGSIAAVSTGDSGAPAIDALGYTTVSPTVSAPTFRIIFDHGDASVGTTWASQALPDALYADEVTTAFVGHDDQGYLVLWCSDAVGTSAASWFVAR